MTDAEFMSLVEDVQRKIRSSHEASVALAYATKARDDAESATREAEESSRKAWARLSGALRERSGVSEEEAMAAWAGALPSIWVKSA